jgi:signal transduction histidine kinase
MNLSTKFAVAATALTAFIVGGVILNAVQREQRMIVQEVERKGMILAETLAMASVNALLSHDYSTLKRFLEAAAKDPDIAYAMVLDRTGIIKMHTDLTQIGRSVSDDVGARALDSDEVLVQRVPGKSASPLYDVAAPVLAAGRQVGVLRLGLSTQGMQAALRRSRGEVALIGLAALVLGVGGAVALTRRISRPLRELVAGARAVSHGDLAWRARVSSRDEVGELAAAFSAMTASLRTHIDERIREERLVLLGKMAAGIAHEVRNPLEAIKGAATVLEGNGAADPTVRKFTRIIKDEVTDLNRFLVGFLEFARPAPLRLETADLPAIADEVVALLEPLLDERRIRVGREMAADLPAVQADAHQIKQVLMNLCLNAIQAMPEGGEMVLTGRSSESEDRPGVVLSVRDTGGGVAESVLQQVFEPFITTKAGGSGLGLAVSRSIIERHAGRIWVESAPDRGSTFSIWLPQHATSGTDVAPLN